MTARTGFRAASAMAGCMLVTAVSISGFGGGASATDLPQRKPGHWQMKMTMPMAGGTRTIDACISEGDDIAKPKDQKNCGKPEITQTANGVSTKVTCSMNGTKQTITSNFSGDFQSAYQGTVTMAMDPPMAGMGNGFEMSVDAKYIGPDCPADAIAVPH